MNVYMTLNIKKIAENGMINFTVSGKKMDLHDENNKLKVVRENGSKFLHINKLTINIYSHQRYIKLIFYLKFPIPIKHRQFFKIISQNIRFVDYFCNDSNNVFHFAIRKWLNCM